MACMLKISEAASLAFHSAAYLASNNERPISTKEIASKLGVSDNHLSKVMQRLVGAGIVESTRGPGGGFRLNASSSKITLMDIYVSIQGPVTLSDCLLNKPICLGKECILGGLLAKVNREVSTFLTKTKLSKFKDTFRVEK
jgi:Rrf2 family transcriptional regulator, nitric oxide-sensitive transcriptional repressor